VDFFIPGVEKVGGFSMCSSPGLLQREGIIELAVNLSQPDLSFFSKSSIIEKCGEFPNKLSCNFHVTQQRAEVEPHLQPFVRGNLRMYTLPHSAGMIN
ncbi:hypothetical protein GOODEAATRI_007927, partial [Goodea atripinnis]